MWNLFGVADADQQSENRPAAANSNAANAAAAAAADTFSEPECDYDRSPTQLYKLIENKRWDAATVRAQSCPEEARTWVCRREKQRSSGNSNKYHEGSGSSVQQQQQQQQGGGGQIRWRLLPIHATCVFRSPLSLIEALIEAYPDGTQMKDDQGMLPVHLACRNGASKGVVTTLLYAFPDSLDVKDRKGRVPLNFVEQSTSQNREAVLAGIKKFQKDQLLLATNHHPHHNPADGHSALSDLASHSANSAGASTTIGGGGANEVDYEHRTILFRLILKKDWAAVKQRAAEYPHEAATWIVTKGFNGNLRFLPIHKACVLAPPESVIDALLDAHPEGARSKDQDGWIALHCACFYGSSEEVVRALLRVYPKGAQCLDDEGRLAVHYSCLKAASDPVVMALLSAFPKGAMTRDNEQRLPLAHACSKGASEAVISALLKVAPKAAQARDSQGRLPLHHATRKAASVGVVRALLRVYPRAAQTPDDTQKLPIHYACQANNSSGTPSVAVVEQLLAAYPESINIKNGFGYTPLAEAKAADAGAKMEPIVEALEAFKTKQERIKSQDGRGLGSAEISDAEIAALQSRIVALEDALRGIGSVAEDLRSDLRKKSGGKKDAALAPVKKFAERLVRIVEDAVPEEEEEEEE